MPVLPFKHELNYKTIVYFSRQKLFTFINLSIALPFN